MPELPDREDADGGCVPPFRGPVRGFGEPDCVVGEQGPYGGSVEDGGVFAGLLSIVASNADVRPRGFLRNRRVAMEISVRSVGVEIMVDVEELGVQHLLQADEGVREVDGVEAEFGCHSGATDRPWVLAFCFLSTYTDLLQGR